MCLKSVDDIQSTEGQAFTSDYRGYRVKVVDGSTTKYNFYSLAGQLVGTYNSDGSFDTEYFHLNGRAVAAVRNAPSRIAPPAAVTALNLTPLDPYPAPANGISYYKGTQIGSKDGRVAVAWQNGGGAPTAYVVERSTLAAFTTIAETITVESSTSYTFIGLGTGLHYFRVRACNTAGCSANAVGAQAAEVAPPPAAPALQFTGTEGTSAITGYPMDANANYSVAWGTAAGATSYELYRGTMVAAGPAVVTGTATQAGPFALADGNYAHAILACAGNGCIGSAAGGYITVALAPSTPTTVVGSPSPSINGTFAVTWQQPAGGTVSVTEVWESTNGASFTKLATPEPATTQNRRYDATRTNGSYAYQVRACNASGACSPLSATSASVAVTVPVPPSGLSANPNFVASNEPFLVSWSAVGGSGFTYDLQQASNSSFTSPTTVCSGPSTYKSLSRANSGIPTKSFYYRVRSCIAGQCSAYSGTITVSVEGTGGSGLRATQEEGSQ